MADHGMVEEFRTNRSSPVLLMCPAGAILDKASQELWAMSLFGFI